MSVQSKMSSGAAWMTVMMVLDRSIGLISTLILARLLVPEDFGVVAMCMSVIAGLQLFMAFGFDMVLIQKQDADRAHYDTVFTLNLILGLITCGAVAASANLTASYYDEPRVVQPMYVLAFAFLFRSFENIRVVDLRKDLEFRKEAVFRVAQKLSGFFVTIPLAIYLKSYWAMVIGTLALNVFSVVLSYFIKPYMPRISLSKAAEIFDFSLWLLIRNFLLYLNNRFSDFVVGGRLGAAALGTLNLSVEVAATPATQLVAAANRAIYPGYAKLADDTKELTRTYLSVMCAISIVAVPIGLGIASVADLIVSVALGDKWGDAVILIKILGIASILSALDSNTNYIFYALAKPRQLTYFAAVHVAVLLPAMYFLVGEYGIVGAAAAMLAASCISLPVFVVMASWYTEITLAKLFAKVWRSLLAGYVMFVVVGRCQTVFLENDGLLSLILSVVIGALVYPLVLVALVFLTGFRSLEEWKIIRRLSVAAFERLQICGVRS